MFLNITRRQLAFGRDRGLHTVDLPLSSVGNPIPIVTLQFLVKCEAFLTHLYSFVGKKVRK